MGTTDGLAERFADLPVTVDLPGALGQEVTAWVEVEAGWQVVAGDGPPAPALALTPAPVPGTPCVVVIDGVPDAERVRDALLGGALDVLGWPQDRDRLLDAPLRSRAGRGPRPGPGVVGVAGAGGGAGTSTVALAVGGLLAWSGRATVVVGGDDLLALCGLPPWHGPGAAELSALDPAGAAAELPGLARPVAGLDGLAVLGGSAGGPPDTSGWAVGAVVVDLGTLSDRLHRTHPVPRRPPAHLVAVPPSPGRPAPAAPVAVGAASGRGVPDLLVARPDGSLRVAATTPADVPVLVVGEGPLDRAGARHLLGRAPVAWLPSSARVARAGMAGRVPSGLPGTWLAALRRALGRVQR